MPRYFLHLRYGPQPDKLAVDHEGDELADDDTARQHALTVAGDLILRTRTDIVRDWFDCTFEITDEEGRPVMRVPFGDVVPAMDEHAP